MIINRFDQQHAGAYTCRPIPPQNVQSPSVSLTMGRKSATQNKLFIISKVSYSRYASGNNGKEIIVFAFAYKPSGSWLRTSVLYIWYRIVGDQVVAKGHYQNLTFPSVGAQDAGQYYCIASNRLGSQSSLVSSLTVLYPPKNTSILARPSSVVDAGRPLTLTCSSQAYPAVDNFTWHRLTLDGGTVQCRLKVIALASAVGVSAGLITLTVAVMISKNMHRVDMDTIEDVNKRPPVTPETICHESAEQTHPVRKGKMSDIPEEPDDLSDTSHPSIVPLMDAPPIKGVSGRCSASNLVSVHYSQMSR
ncbi:hypothetical protein GOODEAATRI_011845 [Goodea atripinnis]|uniref:Ig-like domain-containing protein n=1 Tax=Goodea atripinnis TaxID=208336 RepID=A0ABV0N0M5_9TELE